MTGCVPAERHIRYVLNGSRLGKQLRKGRILSYVYDGAHFPSGKPAMNRIADERGKTGTELHKELPIQGHFMIRLTQVLPVLNSESRQRSVNCRSL